MLASHARALLRGASKSSALAPALQGSLPGSGGAGWRSVFQGSASARALLFGGAGKGKEEEERSAQPDRQLHSGVKPVEGMGGAGQLSKACARPCFLVLWPCVVLCFALAKAMAPPPRFDRLPPCLPAPQPPRC